MSVGGPLSTCICKKDGSFELADEKTKPIKPEISKQSLSVQFSSVLKNKQKTTETQGE
jgi:hypothetical protein